MVAYSQVEIKVAPSKAWSCSELQSGNSRLLNSKLEQFGDDHDARRAEIKRQMKVGTQHVVLQLFENDHTRT